MNIRITINSEKFINDIRALVMAFFPVDEFEIKVEEDKEGIEQTLYRVRMNLGEEHYEIECATEKNTIKEKVYDIFENVSKKSLQWGILTGVRPDKIPLAIMMDGGMDSNKIKKHIVEEYLCNEDKAELITDIAGREYNMIKGLDLEDGISIYIGIPFCPSICSYCSFSSTDIRRTGKLADEYLDKLEEELIALKKITDNKTIHSVYIGGGTPTALNEPEFERLLCIVDKYIEPDKALEYCVEAGRPDSITADKLRSMKNHKVSRISINPQTMSDDTLKSIGRFHSIESFVNAYHLAREMGFDNINTDLIIGLPGEDDDCFKESLDRIFELDPEEITIHTLVIKRAAYLNTAREDEDKPVIEKATQDIEGMQKYAVDKCREKGYLPYYMYRQKNSPKTNINTNQENIGYAKPGYECLYNVLMMEELENVMAFGAGAVSKHIDHDIGKIERIPNVKSLHDYLNRTAEMAGRKLKFEW